MRRHFRTLVSRILWLHLVAIVIATAALIVSIHLVLNTTFAAFEHRALSAHAAAIAKTIDADGAGVSLHLTPELASLYAHQYDGYSYAVLDRSKQVLATSGDRIPSHLTNISLVNKPTFFQKTEGPDTYFSAAFPQRTGHGPVWIMVSQNLQDPNVYTDDVVGEFLRKILWLVAPIVLLLLGADAFVVLRALKPVVDASRRAASIHPQRIDIRLPSQGLPSEVAPLVAAMNGALDRLEEGFRKQREFTADIAHDLRTPLTVLRLRADSVDNPRVAGLLRADIDRMIRLVEQLLALAELETFALDQAECTDLRAVALEVSSLMAPAALASGRQLSFAAPADKVWVHGNGESLARALRNLVENALAHSPQGGTVTVCLENNGKLRVSDKGPGVPEAERGLIFRRGWRRDRQSVGNGLGLSIVAGIINAHAGSIEVVEAVDGGACFVMQLQPLLNS